MSSKYRVTKGFKFHARPQTGAYSCLTYIWPVCDRIGNSGRNRNRNRIAMIWPEPEPEPEPDCHPKKVAGFDRIGRI